MKIPKLGTFLFALILLVFCGGLVSGQDLGAPQNLLVTRSGDSFDLTWDAPEGVAPIWYIIDLRWRESIDGDWQVSNSIGGITDTSVTLGAEEVQDYPDPPVFLYEAEFSVYGRFGGANGPAAIVTWVLPPEPPPGQQAGKQARTGKSKPKKERPPTPHTCAVMTNSGGSIVISSPLGLNGGIQCQQIGGAGIGILSIIQAGFIDAVDVWGIVTEATICFKQGGGGFLFLDANTSPRSVNWIDGFDHGSMRCATISGPGSVILMPMIA